ncbi:hypothetical protein Q8W71_29620 [Methylobacterium sp. NEAU 140]|uniref:DUF6894 family protein n=1 Tax=Methylobacterium sp. NEAU 140 TaxID=3064945 RepID=UPI00273369BB|nr:hypothetical protein [Methylobacterium sp. NEAU 140]MDP4026769.1 hypothetical protein [Methylobacterium sp. NEAU 140]
MPRYFVTTSDGVMVQDGEGTELPDLDALEKLLRQTLAAIMSDEGKPGSRNEFRADAADERGERVMTARMSLSVSRL